jgi:hypothetical protein
MSTLMTDEELFAAMEAGRKTAAATRRAIVEARMAAAQRWTDRVELCQDADGSQLGRRNQINLFVFLS